MSNKKIKNATSTIRNDIKFRSKLEAYAYSKLLEIDINFTYEEVTFNLQDKFISNIESFETKKARGKKIGFEEASNNIRAITYTPDFVGRNWIIEIKGYRNDVFPIKWKMFKKHMQDSGFTLFLPSNKKEVDQAIEIIAKSNKFL